MAEHPTEAESSPRQPAASSPVPEQTVEQTPAEGSGEDFHGAEHWATLTGGVRQSPEIVTASLILERMHPKMKTMRTPL